jgi:hypothetical protein
MREKNHGRDSKPRLDLGQNIRILAKIKILYYICLYSILNFVDADAIHVELLVGMVHGEKIENTFLFWGSMLVVTS